jgi:microcystin-dependent protein
MGILAYRAKETTATIGTGALTLAGAPAGARSFTQAFGASSRRVRYVISFATGYEMGLGEFNGSTGLTRVSVVASSNAGALVALPVGTKDVFSWIEPSDRELVAITAGYTVTAADLGNLVAFSGTSAATLALPAIASVPPGASVAIVNSGSAVLTIDPNGSETVNGATTLALSPGDSIDLRRIATGWVGIMRAAAIPIGGLLPFAGANAPGGYLLCNGQNVSRTTYAGLFSVVGTAFGAGDGSTTFGIPDLRGRAPFGRDNMGGSAANRITAGVSGITGTTLGASGGDERLHAHGHAVTDPGHGHTVNDPGHAHQYVRPSAGSLVAGINGTNAGAILSNTDPAGTGITIAGGATGITIANGGAGTAQNMPPALVVNYIIFAGL